MWQRTWSRPRSISSGKQSIKQLQRDEIEAIVIESDDDALLEFIQIDENLCRAELTAAQRARALKRRKVLWEQVQGETASRCHSKDEAVGGKSFPTNELRRDGRRKGPRNEQASAADTAAKTGQSKRNIDRGLHRAEALGEDLDRVAGTSLEKTRSWMPLNA